MDLISRQEALNALREGLPGGCGRVEYLIEQLPAAQLAQDLHSACTDTISRQQAIEALKMDISIIPFAKAREYVRAAIETIYNRLEDLPTSQPQRMRGRWQDITASDCSGYDPVLAGYDDPVVGYVCSTCHEGYEKEVMGEVTWNYCPNCGADMEMKQ